ncbi:hypothetical protein [Microvirga sp. 17 mud 1-3]|uniref:hypothetical protein n=1 Tax=Microvirga sp. 17 mud 1-3 TaxID=2082949 RepID=UPI000D6B28D3|nr:hypothetical protein [Microvirga sp. 17 mud 1-3]AWM88667.1 hypothetical protein C4E04_19320 [Microvirga sp. 17 mud 1-3]
MRLLAYSFTILLMTAWAGTPALSLEDGAPGLMTWDETWDQAWNAENVDIDRYRALSAPKIPTFGRTEVWSSGLIGSPAAVASPSQRAVGAKLRPFADLDLLVGTQMSRNLDIDQALNARMDWQLTWSRQWAAEALEIGLTTTGAVDPASAVYTQSAGGSLGIRLPSAGTPWDAQLVVSPNINLDTTTGGWSSSLRSEIVAQRVLTTHKSPIRSVVNIRMGYDFAPETHPTASATLQLSFSPKI